MDEPKTSDHIQIKIKMPNPYQEPPASSKGPIQDLKVMDILCIFKIKIEIQKSEYVVSKSIDHIQIKIKELNPCQEPQAPTIACNQDLKDMDILCTFKIKIETQNLEHGCTKDQ